MMTTVEIINELKDSIERVYGGSAMFTITEDEQGHVVIMPLPGERGPEGWEITISPGSIPLYVHVIGSTPSSDERFTQAIWDKIARWVPDPEHLNTHDIADLENLRARMGSTDNH